MMAQGCLKLIGSYERGPVHGVDVTADYAYIGSGNTLLVVDYVSDPQAPAIVGEVVVSSFVFSVAVRGDFAFVATDELVVVDISDPMSPQTVTTISGLDARHLLLSGDLLIVTTRDGGPRFQFFDVSIPSTPKLLGGVSGGGTFATEEMAAVDGSRGYFVTSDGVSIIDISTPESPVALGTLTLPFTRAALPRGNRLYVIDRIDDLLIFDVTNPTNPNQLGQITFNNPANRFFDLLWFNDHLFLTSELGQIYAIDVSDPSSPQIVAQVATEGQGRFLSILGDQIFAAQFNGGFVHLDASSPTAPQILGLLDTPGQVRGIDVQGDTAYLAAGLGGLKLVDVSDMSQLRETAGYNTLGEAWEVQLIGNIAFVADGPRGLLTVDVSDPLIPRALDDLPSSGDARALEVVGDLAYMASLFSGLHIVDVSFPLLLEEVGEFTQVDRVWDIEIQGDIAYLADHNQGLRVLDVSTPAAPQQLVLRDTPGQAVSLALQDSRLMVGNDFQPTTLYDVQAPNAPQLLSSYDCDAFDVLWQDSTAYMNCRNGEIRAVNVANSGNFSHIATYELFGGFTALALDGDHLYVGRGLGGVDVLDISGCNNLLRDGFESGDVSAWSAAVP